MKISVITTVYKAEQDLPRLLESMMAQKSPELEFFLIDNGSPDRCGEICREYAEKDSRFTVYTLKENIGYIGARNLGIQVCTGDYVGFCDSDDYLEPGGYDHAVEQIKKTQCDLYITAWKTISSTDLVYRPPYPTGVYSGWELLPQAFGPIGGKGILHGFAWKQIFRHSILAEGNLRFLEELKPYEDQVFNIDMLSHCDCVCVDDQVIYNYIVNEQSITAQMISKFDAQAEWTRLTALYREKNFRVEMPEHKEAMSNQLLLSLYALARNIVKGNNCSAKPAVDFFRSRERAELIKAVAQGASRKQTPQLGFVKWCLKHKQYRLMMTVLAMILKGRG